MFLRDSSKQELGQALTQGHKEPPGETLRTKPAGLPAPKGVRCQLAKAQGAPNPPQPCQGSPAKLSPVLCRRWSFIPPRDAAGARRAGHGARRGHGVRIHLLAGTAPRWSRYRVRALPSSAPVPWCPGCRVYGTEGRS